MNGNDLDMMADNRAFSTGLVLLACGIIGALLWLFLISFPVAYGSVRTVETNTLLLIASLILFIVGTVVIVVRDARNILASILMPKQ